MTDTNRMDLSFRNRTDEEKLQSLIEKYPADTEISRLARDVLAELQEKEADG